MEIKTRFDKQNITPVIQMAKILKDACFESLDSISNCSIYSDLLNFDSLKTEILLWKHAKDSQSFQELLESKRSSKLESQRIVPRLKETRSEKIDAQEAKITRQLS